MDQESMISNQPAESSSLPNSNSDNPLQTATPPSGPTSSTTPAMPNQPKPQSSKVLLVTTIICAVLAVAGIAFGVYGMFLKPEPECKTDCQNVADDVPKKEQPTPMEEDTYQLSDYVSFLETTIPVTFPDEVAKGHTEDTLTKIELKNLPDSIIAEFNDAQEKLIPKDDSNLSQENEVGATINDGVLSVYSAFKYTSMFGVTGDAITLNYDLKNNKKLDNARLIALYNLTGEEAYEKILEEIAGSVTIDSFLLSTTGDVTAPKISIAEFKAKIGEYKTTLANSLDLLKLYVDNDNKVHALYEQYEVLNALGMGSHMGVGLISGMQDTILQ